ncbi:MAG: hypothetical protein HYZ34_10065 [Ignavibacteriae bacterium]|nr:hypothetical protein [Ignavibacteriota bacterium]
MYLQLNAEKIIETAEKLHRRIQERFPESGPSNVGGEVVSLSRQSAQRAKEIARPMLMFRICIGLFILLFITTTIKILLEVDFGPVANTLSEFLQAMDASIEIIVLCGGGILFLMTLETRMKRRRALKKLHELRSLAHVIDMHQLTKDPEGMRNEGTSTPSSPERMLSPFELQRYLDYCSELLSIISKLAALYIQHFPDQQISEAVNDVEQLSDGLSRKIWQKIMIIDKGSH